MQILISRSDDFCLGGLYNGTVEACTDCILNYGAVMQQSRYGRAKFPESNFEKMLENCDADPADYPYSYTAGPPAPTTTGDPPPPSPEPSCDGETYTAKEGETCDEIALANSMSSFRLRDINNLDVDCEALQPGRELCIRDTCKLTTIKTNQTCQDFVAGKGFSIVQLMSWNP